MVAMCAGRGVVLKEEVMPITLRKGAANTYFLILMASRWWRRSQRSGSGDRVCSSSRGARHQQVVSIHKNKWQMTKLQIHDRLKVCMEFVKPNDMQRYSNKPNGVMIAILGMSAGFKSTLP